MRWMYWLSTTLVLGTAACSGESPDREHTSAAEEATLEDVQRETREAAATGQRYVSQELQDWEDSLAARREEVQKRLLQLEAQAVELAEPARQDMQAQLEVVKQKQAAFEQRMQETKSSTGKARKDLEEGLEEAWADVEAALEKASARYEADASKRKGER